MILMKVCVIGLGRIGMPMAALCAAKGHTVIGVDKGEAALKAVADAEPLFEEEGLADTMRKNKPRLSATSDIAKAVAASDVVVVTIGTTITEDGKPVLDNAYDVARGIAEAKPRGKTVIFKPTLPLGTTRLLVAEIEKKSGLKCGKDFFAAFSPERIVEGKALEEMEHLPKVIGGMDAESARRAAEFYRTLGGEIVIVEKPEAAELVKLIDNSYRSTMFAFANDVALVCERWGLNAYDVVSAANQGYKRNNVKKPSCGVSGYCLTKDPLYLESGFASAAKERGFPSLWKRGRDINDYMPTHTLGLLKDALAESGRPLKGARVAICGATFKENVDDVRNSHGIRMADELRREGAEVSVWDPRAERIGFPRKKSAEDAFDGADAVVFTVPHDEFKPLDVASLAKKMRTPVIVDGWGLFTKLRGSKGYRCVGVG
ncbi:hypothetical protein COU36_01245 [Candidatus Micrarchaeota archaeon CG10_big_fil_rev_8_21_14_0_10_59_7]|nr:MAG: hypothetical protein COU36_01245 [Candidatus Micrarchaeota archaeon CG10_big_fil_rev_8_21_14_0_10_59_7]